MITEVLKKVSQHSLVYGIGTLLGRFVGFVMIPFYTHFLLPADYAVIELLDLTTFFLSTIVGLGLTAAVIRFFYDYQDEGERREVVSTALLFGMALLVGFYALLWTLSPTFSQWMFGRPDYDSYFRIVFASLCFDTLAEIALSHIRAKQQSVKVTLFTLARLVTSLVLNVYFLASLHLGVLGIIYSNLISTAGVALVLTTTTLREVGWRFSRSKLLAMVRFGLPLIPTSIGMFVLNYSDRFFLQHFGTLSEVGIYSLGYKFGMVNAALISAPFFLFWGAYAYEVIGRPDGREVVARIQVYFTSVLLAATLAIAMFGDPLIRAMCPPEYWPAAQVIPLIGMSYLLLGMSFFFRLGLNYTKQTKYVGYAMAVSALLNVPLNLILIPRFLAIGAALATLLSFAALTLATFQASQRGYRIPYEYARLVKLLVAGVIVFGVSKLLPLTSLLPALLMNGACLLALPVLLHAMRFFEDRELDRATAFARMLVSRVRPVGVP
jgi:O-antigen/teichoic acid export membrane protein